MLHIAAPPAGFGPMDIEFNFPSYEPSVDDSFFDSDSGYGNTGYNSGFGSGSTNQGGSYSNSNNGNSNSNSGGGGGGGSSYSMRTKYAGTYYNRSSGVNSSTTPGTATPNSTQYATYTTAASGGAGGVGGVTGGITTTVAPGSLLLCSPSSDPSITGGRCVNTAALSTLCKTPFVAAPSTNCQTGNGLSLRTIYLTQKSRGDSFAHCSDKLPISESWFDYETTQLHKMKPSRETLESLAVTVSSHLLRSSKLQRFLIIYVLYPCYQAG